MSTIAMLLESIRNNPSCRLSPPGGLPSLPKGIEMPDDLRKFYTSAGGAILFGDRVCAGPVRIVGPAEFIRIDLAIMGECFGSGPFVWWYALADVMDGNYISIDLSPDNSGACLDSFHETFAMPGYVNVVASSFSDFLQRVLGHAEDSSYWLQDDFVPLGEAFQLHGLKPSA